MADRTAKYYEELNPSAGQEPFATLAADQGYQYFPTYPDSVKDAFFVPSRELAWNGVESLVVVVEGTSVELSHSRREYNFSARALEDVWGGAAVTGVYSVTATFSDYSTVLLQVLVDDGDERRVYHGIASAAAGEVTITLAEAAGDDSSDESGEPSTLSATMTTTPVLTATGEELNFYAVTAASEKTHAVVYKWYNADGTLHQEVHTVADGDDYPRPGGALPSLGSAWTGAWIPAGPGDGEGVTSDITCEYVLTADDSITLELDWRISGGTGTEAVKGFKWCHPFPALAEKSTVEGKTLQGIYLVGDGSSEKETGGRRVYNTAADPCAPLKERIDIGGYSLEAHWMSSAAFVSDIGELRALVGVLPSTFAGLPTAKTDISPLASATDINFRTGFPTPFEEPLPSGKVITRQMMNTLGNLGSQAQFFEQCGGYYTFDKGFCDAIGGYPKGAYLQFFDESANALRTVCSLVEPNFVNFLEGGVDGVNWEFVGDSPIVNVKVDYSSYEDLSNRLFVETGVPDLYEVPYDAYLQAFAVGSVDCDSLRRPASEDVVRLYDDEYSFAKYFVHINGLYYAEGHGESFLDIYHRDSQAFGSLLMGGFHPCTMLEWGGRTNVHHAVRTCPLSAFSCGVMLSKGDKIRVRNVITEKNGVVEMPTGNNDFVHPMTHGDETIVRKYNYRFAALYRRGLVQ